MKTIYDKICLMLPTYKRPQSILSFVNSALETAANPTALRFCFCVNEEDAVSRETIEALKMPAPDMVEIITEDTDQPNLALYFNLMYDGTAFNEDGTLVSMVGDDMVFVTHGWDAEILKTMNEAEGAALIYCDDDFIAHEKLCVNLFTSRALVRAQKKPFMCKEFHADMIDLVWFYVATMASVLKYLPHVIIKHNHNTAKPPEQWDPTFQRISPVQRAANSAANKRYAVVYSTVCARNIVEAGIGKWNLL
jgi:hypothetical protein